MIKLPITISTKRFQFGNFIFRKCISTISFLLKPPYIQILFLSISHNSIICLIEALGKKFSIRYLNFVFSAIWEWYNPFFIWNGIFFIYAWNDFPFSFLMFFQLIPEYSIHQDIFLIQPNYPLLLEHTSQYCDPISTLEKFIWTRIK